MSPQYLDLDWNRIAEKLAEIENYSAGFTNSSKGILTLDSGQSMFVKKANDSLVNVWTKKEIETYKVLNKHDFFYTPKLLSYSEDYSSFAIEALTAEDGWEWSNIWSEARLDATFRSMDALASLPLSDSEKSLFNSDKIRDFINGWQLLFDNQKRFNSLILKLKSDPAGQTINFNLEEELNFSRGYKFNNTTLVHNDIRSDNSPYSASRNTAMLVDWPWAVIGDPRIDLNSLLVHVQLSGFDITKAYMSKLDMPTLQWLAGYWFSASTEEENDVAKKHLRDLQFRSGLKALQLVRLFN